MTNQKRCFNQQVSVRQKEGSKTDEESDYSTSFFDVGKYTMPLFASNEKRDESQTIKKNKSLKNKDAYIKKNNMNSKNF